MTNTFLLVDHERQRSYIGTEKWVDQYCAAMVSGLVPGGALAEILAYDLEIFPALEKESGLLEIEHAPCVAVSYLGIQAELNGEVEVESEHAEVVND